MQFPRTEVGGLSVSRMIIGTNWLVGYSHQTPAKDRFIKDHIYNRTVIAEILEVYLNHGVDAIMGILESDPVLLEAINEAEDRTGREVIRISTPIIDVSDTDQARGEVEELFDRCVEVGVDICMPHHVSVEQLIDKGAQAIHRIDDYTQMIRSRDMIPGLSAHMPEVVRYADRNNNDVETYIQIYNCAGFLMQIEVETVYRGIQNASHPVMCIKPMAAGRVTPFVGLSFVWNTIREQDMVTVGTMTPAEAREVIELSAAILEQRTPEIIKRGSPADG